MSQFRNLVVRGLLDHCRLALLAAAALALLAGLLVAFAYRRSDEQALRHLIDTLAQRQAVQLEAETLRGKAMGVAALLGVNEPVLKALAQGRLPPAAPEALARLQPVLQSLGAEAIHVTDAAGRVVALVPRVAPPLEQLQQRHWWQQALAGIETVHPEVNAATRRRSFLLAAPLYAGPRREGEAIGVVVIRLSAEDLEARLYRSGGQALLVSPQGVVFASSDERWLFRLTHRPDARQLAELRELQQFGPDFAATAPQLLPFDIGSDAVQLHGARYLRARASLQWPDPAGRWQIVLLAAPRQQVSLAALLSVAAGVALLLFALQLMLLRLLQGNAARHAALARSEEASRQLQRLAEHKASQSELTLQLQLARELPALAATLFGELARFLPVHQASLYFVDTDGSGEPLLRLAGAYATDAAPAQLALGEGLLGQCALERKRLALTEVPAGFWRVSSGLGAAWPRVLLLLPVLRNDRLLGVLEVASLASDPAPVEAVLDSLLPVLATNLEVLLAERRLGRLLGEARADAERNASRLNVLLDSAPSALLLLDGEGRVLLSNRAAQTIFGYDAPELAKLSIAALLPQGLPAAADAGAWQTGIGRRKDGRAVALTLALKQSAAELSGASGPCTCLVLRAE